MHYPGSLYGGAGGCIVTAFFFFWLSIKTVAAKSSDRFVYLWRPKRIKQRHYTNHNSEYLFRGCVNIQQDAGPGGVVRLALASPRWGWVERQASNGSCIVALWGFVALPKDVVVALQPLILFFC